MDINVVKGRNCTLKMSYLSDGRIKVWLAWDSGVRHGYWNPLTLSSEDWDRLVAWVEWQRKEELLKKAKEKKAKKTEG